MEDEYVEFEEVVISSTAEVVEDEIIVLSEDEIEVIENTEDVTSPDQVIPNLINLSMNAFEFVGIFDKGSIFDRKRR